MVLFSGRACFSPSVPRFLLTAWVTHGGTLVQSAQDFRRADYFFCDGPRDPWLSELLSRSAVVIHASWVSKSVSEQFLMPVARYVLDDHFQPFEDQAEIPNTTRNESVDLVLFGGDSEGNLASADHLLMQQSRTCDSHTVLTGTKPVCEKDAKILPRAVMSSPKETDELIREHPATALKRPLGSEHYSDSEQNSRPRKKTRFLDESGQTLQTNSRRHDSLVVSKRKPASASASALVSASVSVAHSTKSSGLLVSRIPRYKCAVSIGIKGKNPAVGVTLYSKDFGPAVYGGVWKKKEEPEEFPVSASTAMTMTTTWNRASSTLKVIKEKMPLALTSLAKDPCIDFFQTSKQDLSLSCNLSLRISVAALLKAAGNAPSSGAVLFTSNGEFMGKRFSCVKRGKLLQSG